MMGCLSQKTNHAISNHPLESTEVLSLDAEIQNRILHHYTVQWEEVEKEAEEDKYMVMGLGVELDMVTEDKVK